VDSFAAAHGAHDVAIVREIGDDDFGAKPAKLGGSVIVMPNHRANGQAALEQSLGHATADAAHMSAGACDQDRCTIFHDVRLGSWAPGVDGPNDQDG
jgi:hypothetical protein